MRQTESLARDRLWDVAVDAYGFITMADARRLGIADDALWMLAHRDQIRRVAHGVYRFPKFPPSDRDPYMLAVLWTGRPEACLSHDTVLAVHELCDINPGTIHVTVVAGTRIRRSHGDRYSLHFQSLRDDQRAWWEGIPAVTVETAIAQCIAAGTATYLMRQAIDNGTRMGLLTAAGADRLNIELEVVHD